MVNTNSVLSSILFSQTIDWNIKQFFSSTSINSSFELKRIGKARINKFEADEFNGFIPLLDKIVELTKEQAV